MSVVQELQQAGLSYTKARLIADELRRFAPIAKEQSRNETLYRPQNKLADLAIRLGCPRESAMSVALAFV